MSLCHICERSHVTSIYSRQHARLRWMSHVAHMNGSYRTYEWVMSHLWMSPRHTQNESCHTFRMSPVTNMKWAISVYSSELTRGHSEYAMTRSVCMSWLLLYVCYKIRHVWHDDFITLLFNVYNTFEYTTFVMISWQSQWRRYGVALVSRIDKIVGLFCKRALFKRQYSAKEIYNVIDPTYRSHPIIGVLMVLLWVQYPSFQGGCHLWENTEVGLLPGRMGIAPKGGPLKPRLPCRGKKKHTIA